MSLEEVKEVQHVRDPRMVNEMIKVGWVLIDTDPALWRMVPHGLSTSWVGSTIE